MFALVWFDLRALCDIVPYRSGYLLETWVGRAAEKAGCAQEQESFRNLWSRTGSWKNIGKRGAGLWGTKAMCHHSCKTRCDPSPSLHLPIQRSGMDTSGHPCWRLSICKKRFLTPFHQHRFRSLPKPLLWVRAFSFFFLNLKKKSLRTS